METMSKYFSKEGLERRKKSEEWVKQKTEEFCKSNTLITFAEWCYQQGKAEGTRETNDCPYIVDKKCDIAKCEEFHIRADERAKTIDEYKNKVWKDIETRYRNDVKILGYLSSENLLKDVHNSLYYFAEQMKGETE